MTMREKMARAMCEKAREQGSRGVTWDDVSEGHRRECLGLADVALDELMKPTEEMSKAAISIDRTCLGLSSARGANLLGRCMAAMIGAARDGA